MSQTTLDPSALRRGSIIVALIAAGEAVFLLPFILARVFSPDAPRRVRDHEPPTRDGIFPLRRRRDGCLLRGRAAGGPVLRPSIDDDRSGDDGPRWGCPGWDPVASGDERAMGRLGDDHDPPLLGSDASGDSRVGWRLQPGPSLWLARRWEGPSSSTDRICFGSSFSPRFCPATSPRPHPSNVPPHSGRSSGSLPASPSPSPCSCGCSCRTTHPRRMEKASQGSRSRAYAARAACRWCGCTL